LKFDREKHLIKSGRLLGIETSGWNLLPDRLELVVLDANPEFHDQVTTPLSTPSLFFPLGGGAHLCARLFMSAIVSALGVGYELSNGRKLFSNLSFSLEARLAALVGPNGIGKTCLARILAGELEPTEGTVHRKGCVTLFPQCQEPESVTVAEFLSATYEWSLLREVLLQSIDLKAICTTLSGGQWMRVRLARALDNQFLILMDEPTNDLDREGREALVKFLRHREGGALLISHDRECLQICEEILELSNRGISKFGGDWSGYMEAKERERERLGAALDLAKRDRELALLDRAEQLARQNKRNHRGAESAARGGMPKVLLGARKRRAQSATGRLNAASQEQADKAVREAHEALTEMKISFAAATS
jgi:ATPase subunit of ABC transporter with duplicated ATPase domains